MMPTYRLECILRFADQRPGMAVDGRNIEAVSRGEAIELAKLYECNKPGMVLSAVSLFDKAQVKIWSFQIDPPSKRT
ncbi:hypothetical protein MKK68_22910 [Methylobacterium sp. E-016]|uniref:hypothetical protein n=1 Tax=Methylobacterium sp. E-016 TaxID=2836556 RepID=UPI001FBC00C8|nr:hypothetical protein [Methylobacterium sp. E-016]MCJ2078461.1 hypothetical protein [Methylobacterium sp. E-016]